MNISAITYELFLYKNSLHFPFVNFELKITKIIFLLVGVSE